MRCYIFTVTLGDTVCPTCEIWAKEEVNQLRKGEAFIWAKESTVLGADAYSTVETFSTKVKIRPRFTRHSGS